MPEHFSKNVLQTTRFCNTCMRNTQWHVWNGRLGSCVHEHHTAPPKPKPEPSKQQDLFPKGEADEMRMR